MKGHTIVFAIPSKIKLTHKISHHMSSCLTCGPCRMQMVCIYGWPFVSENSTHCARHNWIMSRSMCRVLTQTANHMHHPWCLRSTFSCGDSAHKQRAACCHLETTLLLSHPGIPGVTMFLYRFVRHRRPQILVHTITFEQLLGFLSFLAQLLALTYRLPD